MLFTSMMEKACELYTSIPNAIKVAGGVVIAGVTAVIIIQKLQRKPKRKKLFPRDTVVLHQRWRGPYAPSLVPFAVKVETFLRIMKIPYVNEHSMERSTKGKWPWIQYNEDIIADSKFVIDFISQKFQINMNEGFTESDLSMAHAFQKMMEENTYWTFVLNRWVYDKHEQIYKEVKVPGWTPALVKKGTLKQANEHGIGRHTEQEVNEIMTEDLSALSIFLGKKKFLLGKKPCIADCAIFGQLSQFYWHSFGSEAELTIKRFPNLCLYCERMKTLFWPDWEECTSKSINMSQPKDVVILHQVGRGPYVPSMVPFIVKLETYLRMAKVPYQNEHDRLRSSKGKFPWIEYNGEAVPDSSFCVKFVNKTFGVDLNSSLSSTERACAHAWQKMIEENTYWTFALHRWVIDTEEKLMKYLRMPRLILYFVRSDLIKAANGHGMGRHTVEEIYQLMEEDLKALSVYLGQKNFLMGDHPCEEDAALFGQLSQFYWLSYGNKAEQMIKRYPNLCSYCERMKQMFWPDWDDCITHGGTRTPSK